MRQLLGCPGFGLDRCFVVKPAQRHAVALSTDETRHYRLHTHTHDGGRGIVKEKKRRENNIEKEKRKGK